MRKVKRIRLKPKFVSLLKFLGIVICILLGIFIFYRKQINDLKKIGYSDKSSNNILFSLKKDYIVSIGENKTLNEAFQSDDFNEEYLDNYSKIDYVNQKNFIKNINKLIQKGYNNNDINVIFAHGTDQSVSEFAKRDKIRYLEEFFSIDYAKLENYDRYVKYSDETGDDEEDTVLYVNLNLDKEEYTDSITINKFSTDMLVNKYRGLGENFEPDNLVVIDKKYAAEDGFKSNKEALDAYIEMSRAAEKEGLSLIINSAYRSYSDQQDICDTYLKEYGQEYVNKYVAKPGYSEHQTGLAYDIGSRNVNVFANSLEYKWMQENAYKYGFIYRFTTKYQNITGFRNEPWHYRYVGREIAKYIYEHNNMPYEEYYVMFLDK